MKSQTLCAREDGVVVEVAVRPRAGRCKVGKVSAGRLRIEVTSAPEDGAATSQALATLAAAAGVKGADATLLRGQRERHKTILLRGVTIQQCRYRLGVEE